MVVVVLKPHSRVFVGLSIRSSSLPFAVVLLAGVAPGGCYRRRRVVDGGGASPAFAGSGWGLGDGVVSRLNLG